MTCDDVFNALMEEGQSGRPEVAAHLARCPRCRDMQAVLEPLQRLGREEILPTSFSTTSRSPGIDSVQIAQDAARRLQSSPDGSRATRRPSSAWRHVLAFAGGVAAALLIASAIPSLSIPGTTESNSQCLWSHRPSEPRSSGDLVMNCVACHLQSSASR